MEDERLLVEGVLRGQGAPCVTLVRRYQGLVFHVVGSFLNNSADREELCQETFLRVFQKMHTFEHGSLKAWIARVARNVTLNHLRRRSVYQEKLTDSLTPEHRQRIEHAGARRSSNDDLWFEPLRRAVERLPKPSGDIVKLYYYEELSIQEVGAILDLPSGTVKSHLYRARQKLKDSLEGGSDDSMVR